MPTVPMKLPIDFLGRLNLEMNLLERLFGSHVARGKTQSRVGDNRCVAWGLQEAQKGRMGADRVTLGLSRDSISEDLGRRCD